MSWEQQVKILIAGLGSIGRRHLRNLAALGEEDIVLYRTGKSSLPDGELGRYVTEKTLEGALAHNPDAVIVSNPTALHLDVAIPAARAGCHLFIEKPLSHTMERVDELRQAVMGGGGKVLVGFQFRFHPGLVAVKQALDEGRIGTPIYSRAHWGEYLPDWHPWEDYRDSYAARDELGGGAALTLCHPFDYMRFLFGEVQSVRGWTESPEGLGLSVDSLAEATLLMSSGLHATVHVNFIERPPRHYLEVIGTEGRITWRDETGSVVLSRPGIAESTYFVPEAKFERNTLFLSEMKHFLAMMTEDLTPRCSLEDGIEALKIAIAIKDTEVRDK
jgi:predicted dehydrogenase